MGYGDETSTAATSTAIANAPPPLASPTQYIENPKKLLDLLRSDYLTAMNAMQSLNRTQVRTLLNQAKTQKIYFANELFKIMIQVHEIKALELKVNIPSVKLGSDKTKEEVIQEMIDSGMLQFKSRTFGSNSHEYPVYFNEKTQSISVYTDNMSAFIEKNAQVAYDAFLQRKYVLETFPSLLIRFFKNSNQSIIESPFFLELATLLIKSKNWELFAELLLRVEKEETWFQDETPFDQFVNMANEYLSAQGTAESLAYQRCVSILRERCVHSRQISINGDKQLLRSLFALFEKYHLGWGLNGERKDDVKATNNIKTIYPLNEWSHINVLFVDLKKIRGIFPKIKNTPQDLARVFPVLGRIERAAMLLKGTKEERQAFLSPSNSTQPNPKLQFFKDFFSDVFSYTTETDFDWLTCVNLSPELADNFAEISSRFSQIITWEMFDAVYYLFQPMSIQDRLHLIETFTEEAWAVIAEFPIESKKLVDYILSTLSLADDASMGIFLDNVTVNILSQQIDLNTAQHLYVKFYSLFQAKEKYIPGIRQLLVKTEKQIEKQITANYMTEITHADQLIERKLQEFISQPETFVQLLNTHFILAHKYFKRMNNDQIKAMAQNAVEHKIRLIETLIEINAFAGQESYQSKFKIPDFKLTKENVTQQNDAQGKPLIDRLKKTPLNNGTVYDGKYPCKYTYTDTFYKTYWHTYKYERLIVLYGQNDSYNSTWDDSLNFLYKYFLCQDYADIATIEMARKLLTYLPVSPFMQWPDDDKILKDIFMGLMNHNRTELFRCMLFDSDIKILRRYFISFIGKNTYNPNPLYPDTFISWLTSPRKDDYPIKILFESLGIDLVKGFLNSLNENHLESIIIKLLQSSHLSPETKRNACLGIAGMSSCADFFESFFTDKIIKAFMQPENMIYAKALHSLAPEFFKEQYLNFHLAVVESAHDKFDQELIAQMQALHKAQYAPIVPHEEFIQPPPPYSLLPPQAGPAPMEALLIERINTLEQQVAQQNIIMGQLIYTLNNIFQPPIDKQAYARIHELEIEIAQRELIEISRKEKEERKLNNMIRFSQGVADEGTGVRLKRTSSLGRF